MEKFISRQCRTVGDGYLIRQLKMPAPITLTIYYYLSAWENKE